MTWLIVFCSLLGTGCLFMGIWIGGVWERHAADRDAREDQAGAEADEYIGQLVESDPEAVQRRRAMARRTHPVYRQLTGGEQFTAIREAGQRAWAIQQEHTGRRTSTAAFLNPLPIAHDGYGRPIRGQLQLVPPEIAHEAFPDETDDEFTARMAAAADEIIAWAHAALDPEDQS